MSDAEQRTRSERATKVDAASRNHAVVQFAAGTFILEGETLIPRSSTTSTVLAKLTALGPTDDLIAAVMGLTDLAFLLRRDEANAAADAIVEAIKSVATLVDDAISTWPPEEAALAGLRAFRFASFMGNAPTAPVEKRPPAANQVGGGPLAMMAAQKLVKSAPASGPSRADDDDAANDPS